MDSSKPPSETQPSAPLTTTNDSNDTHDSAMAAAVMAAPILPPSMSPLTTANLHVLNSNSPPHSNGSSPTTPSDRRNRSPKLSLDLSNMPPLSSPAPPSNTLLITRLEDPKLFHPASLATIRQHLNSIAPLNSFSPLKSMARIIVSFYDEESAINVRQAIDGTAFSPTAVAKCYFGEPTLIGEEKKYLERPDAGRLFFISPPPSPPVGWEMRMEDPPNKDVHADDLADQLAKLAGRIGSDAVDQSSPQPGGEDRYTAEEISHLKSAEHHQRALSSVFEQGEGNSPTHRRSRSSTLIYDPKLHGDSPGLPAVMLETEDDSDIELDNTSRRAPMAHTSRPPVELMEH